MDADGVADGAAMDTDGVADGATMDAYGVADVLKLPLTLAEAAVLIESLFVELLERLMLVVGEAEHVAKVDDDAETDSVGVAVNGFTLPSGTSGHRGRG